MKKFYNFLLVGSIIIYMFWLEQLLTASRSFIYLKWYFLRKKNTYFGIGQNCELLNYSKRINLTFWLTTTTIIHFCFSFFFEITEVATIIKCFLKRWKICTRKYLFLTHQFHFETWRFLTFWNLFSPSFIFFSFLSFRKLSSWFFFVLPFLNLECFWLLSLYFFPFFIFSRNLYNLKTNTQKQIHHVSSVGEKQTLFKYYSHRTLLIILEFFLTMFAPRESRNQFLVWHTNEYFLDFRLFFFQKKNESLFNCGQFLKATKLQKYWFLRLPSVQLCEMIVNYWLWNYMLNRSIFPFQTSSLFPQIQILNHRPKIIFNYYLQLVW